MEGDRLVFGRLSGVLLLAPSDFFQLSQEELEIVSNGCGSNGALGRVVPDSMWGQDMSPSCHVHDFMYQLCRGIVDEIISDCVFAFNLIAQILMSGSGKVMMFLKLGRAVKYISAVALTMRSDKYWEQNQGKGMPSRFIEASLWKSLS